MSRNRKVLEMSTGDMTKKLRTEKAAQSSMIVQDPSDLDKLPQDLNDTKAKKEWKRVVPELKKMDIVGRLDITNLVAYCNAYSKYCEATKALRGQPLTVPSPSGEKENPLINVQIKYAEMFRKFADQCGLTINSRLKWAATKTKQQEEQIESEFGAI
jgi:P27 family predicted phage terminase small subunit